MTDKAKRWALVYVGLAVIFVIFFGSFEGVVAIAGVMGQVTGALFVGGIVATVLQYFWKKHTAYELWFTSAAICMALLMVSQLLGIQR